MPSRFLIRTERWKHAGLASRITLLSAMLMLSVMLPILALSYAAIHALLADEIEAHLSMAATTTRLGFETRLAAALDKLSLASHSPRDTLADAAARQRDLLPMLQRLCASLPAIDALALADAQGQPVAQGCSRAPPWSPEQGERVQQAISEGRRTLTVSGTESALRLSVAAPVSAAGARHAAAIAAELDLQALFELARLAAGETDGPYALHLRHTAAQPVAQPGAAAPDTLTHLAPLTAIDGEPIPLAVEVAIDRTLAYRPLHGLLAGFLATGVGVLALVAWQSRRLAALIAAPLAELERTAARVAAGELDAVPLPPAPDDSDSFRRLSATVYHMIAALRDTQQRLTATLELRTAEAARAEGERLLKEQALASTDSGVVILRGHDGQQRVHYANPAFLRITGLSAAVVHFADWPFGVFPHSVGALIEAGAAGGEPIAFTLRRADGSHVHIEMSASQVADSTRLSQLHTIVVANDVSRRVHVEHAHHARLQSLREIVFELDRRSRCVFLNQSWERITGHTVERTLHHDLRPFVHPDDLLQHQPQLAALSAGEIQAYETELRVRCHDGSLRWMRVDVAAIRDEQGALSGFSGTMSDVTKQHEARLAIALRERALQAVTNGIVITDLQQPDNPIIYVNPAFEKITGYTLDEVVGQNCRLLSRHDRSQPEVSQLRDAVAARKPCTVTLENCRKDGSKFWNQISITPLVNPLTGTTTHYVGVQTDITERKRNDDLLLEWLSRLDAVFTLSPDPLVCFDDGGKISYANVAAERAFCTNMGALTGMSLTDFGAHIERLLDRDHPGFRLPAARPEDNAPHEAADLAQDCILHLAHPNPCTLHQTYRYCGASSTSLVLYYRDVTREAELDRMKSEFLSTAAHELRTPMASIMGFSELLMMRKYDEARTRELLGIINRQAQRLTSLLTDLLDLARIEARRAESFRFEPVPLHQAIDDAIGAFLMPDERHRLVLELPARLPHIRMDRAKFQQAMLNLLSNACKFSPAGGDVEVAIRDQHPEGLAFIGVSVRDHGIGMNAEEASRAFERFYRTDRSGHIPGTGLGLSLVREIMMIHGGAVTLESEVDHGTCITLWFPLTLSAEEPTRPTGPLPQIASPA